MKKLRDYIAPLCFVMLAPIALVLQSVFFAHPLPAEGYASRVYPVIARPISLLTGLLPFSLAELILVTSIVWLPLMIYRFYKKPRKNGKDKLDASLLTFTKVSAVACCGYFVYMLLCGFNYARMPYADIAGYDVSPATAQTLQTVCFELADEANLLRAELGDNQGESLAKIAARVQKNFDGAAIGAQWLSGQYGAPKGVFFSEPMARTQITGIFIPFTVEANYNRVNSHFMYASTMAHEAAHQRGFMREDEANFIAWYVCRQSDSVADRYSGAMLALIHATNALYSASPELYYEVYDSYSRGVKDDLRQHNELWAQYDGKAAEVQEKVNDAYLQSNKQEDGVRSYGRMVNLLIGFYRAEGLIE